MSTPTTTTSTKPLVTPTGPVPGGATPIKWANMRKELGILALLIVVCLVTYAKNHAFLGPDNLVNLARLVGIYGIFSIGAGIVIITGGIDLSVGSVFALEGVILAIALNIWHVNPILGILIAVSLTMGLGLIHGLLITKVPLQPFIVTLCGLLIYRGMARFVSGDNTEGFGDGAGYTGILNLATGSVHLGSFMMPNSFIALVIVGVIMWVAVHRSVYGRYLFAVGRNEEAARYSGINSQRIIASAYIVAGLLTGLAGILLAFYTNSISPASHGGCSLRGGEGSVIGVVIGTTLLQVLQNLVNLLGIPSTLNFAVVGTVILLGVIVDEIVKRRSLKVKAALKA